jgi:hypothetical protein
MSISSDMSRFILLKSAQNVESLDSIGTFTAFLRDVGYPIHSIPIDIDLFQLRYRKKAACFHG